ncbi:MAG TPA: glycerol-3-phosphate ABC transporter ATP-binding protein, partial [Chloroflexi bacterium]|nr:glycerol-3-phosphate ABC transporter ATP-binding protein [Chloroflexota bacterium]
MASVTYQNVTKDFGEVIAVNDLSIHVEDQEFLVLVGPSGCGKTTALRLLAGLEETTGGSISIGDRVVNDVAPKDRDIAMVFQSYALYPHMTVFDNM